MIHTQVDYELAVLRIQTIEDPTDEEARRLMHQIEVFEQRLFTQPPEGEEL